VFACFSAAPCSNNPTSIPSTTPWVISGEDRFRHENSIGSKRWTGTFSGTYYLGDHEIKGGVDYLSNETVDVFGQLLHGSYGFYDKNGNGTPADEIAAGNYGTFVKNYLPEGVTLADAGGTWKYTQVSPFIQDTWQVNDALSVVYGLRVNYPSADHAPPVAVFAATNTPPGMTRAPGVGVALRLSEQHQAGLGQHGHRAALRLQLPVPVGAQGADARRLRPVPDRCRRPCGCRIRTSTTATCRPSSTPAPIRATIPFSADPNDQPGPTSIAPGICSTTSTCQIDVLDPDFKLPSAWKSSLAFDVELPWGLVAPPSTPTSSRRTRSRTCCRTWACRRASCRMAATRTGRSTRPRAPASAPAPTTVLSRRSTPAPRC
jgi:hypothetical protein